MGRILYTGAEGKDTKRLVTKVIIVAGTAVIDFDTTARAKCRTREEPP
jgi:hypothetical protein